MDDISVVDGAYTDTMAAADISGRKHQRVRPTFGSGGASSDVSALTPLPVEVKASAVGSLVAPETGTLTGGQSNVAVTMAVPYTFDGANLTRAGCTPQSFNDVDETPDQIKAAPGVLYGYHWHNMHATATIYLKFYNHAAPTVGTTPTLFYITMKPNTQGHLPPSVPGIGGFTTAMSVAATMGTSGWLDTDTTAPPANSVHLTVYRK